MSDMTDNEAYDKALELWGDHAQMLMAIEEMAELTDKLTKYMRGRPVSCEDIMDEVVDVKIMMKQMERLLNLKSLAIPNLSWQIHERKMARLKDRIQKHLARMEEDKHGH